MANVSFLGRVTLAWLLLLLAGAAQLAEPDAQMRLPFAEVRSAAAAEEREIGTDGRPVAAAGQVRCADGGDSDAGPGRHSPLSPTAAFPIRRSVAAGGTEIMPAGSRQPSFQARAPPFC